MRRGTGERKLRTTVVALAAALGLVAAGCGSRLTPAERRAAIGALTSAGTGQGAARTSVPQPGGGSGVTGLSGSPGGGAGATGSTGTSGGGGTAGEGIVSGASCARATKGTDVGVTADKITIATLADISGVQPGLFQSAHDAAKAAAAYINATGGICGRQIVPLLEDSKTDSGGNRAAMEDACQKAFAVVGSMSAFDDGSAQPGEQCGIPDITAITTNPAKYQATNTYPAYPNGGPYLADTSALYIAKRFPNAIKHAAILWLNQAVTKTNAQSRMRVWAKVGFHFVYQQEVQVLEANYTRFVVAMRNSGVEYVTMVSDFQSIVRLEKAMKQQGWFPQVRDWDSVAYDPQYLQTDPSVVDGSMVFINTAMIEEAASNPEMKLYTEWLQRTSPGAVPDYFGIYAWSAYRLFQKLALQIGPDLTRAKLFAALKTTRTWDDYGMHGPHQTGAKLPTTCNLYLEVKGGRFQRVWPASGFDCSGKLERIS